MKPMAALAETWPTFLILGAAKSGTTPLYRWLRQHPQVHMSPNKQPHYFAGIRPSFCGPGDDLFNRDIITDAQVYRRLLCGGPGRRARGEASPFYLYYAAEAMRRLRQVAPECRLVILLRDPVERAYSGYLHLVRDGREHESFATALRRERERLDAGWEPLWGHRALGGYADQVAAVLSRFPSAQVGVWRFEDLQRHPARLFAEVCRFIGVDDGFVPEFSRHNTGGAPRHPALHALLVRLNAPRLARRVLPERLAQWLVGRYLERRLPPADVAAELRAAFRDDVARLQRLLPAHDFSGWLGEKRHAG
jgi:hypothetical protein